MLVRSLLLLWLLALSATAAAAASGPRFDTAARCQQGVESLQSVYRTSRLADARAGRRAAQKAELFVQLVERACGAAVATPVLPQVGETCQALVVPGEALPARRLAHCLRASIEGEVARAVPGAGRPNLVVVLADDARLETLDVMPAVDRLADEGIRFRNAFVTTALCTPSRASLYSGLYAHNHGSTRNEQDFVDDETIATWLAAAGYTTGFFGKYRNDTLRSTSVPAGWSEWQAFTDPPDVEPGCPRGGGIDCYFGYTLNENGRLVAYGDGASDYSTDLLAERALDFVRANRDRPFLAVLAPAAPHFPAIPAPRHLGSFAGLSLWRPPNWGPRAAGQVPSWVVFLNLIFRGDLIGVVDERRIAELESMRAVDEAVAALADELERQGIADQTLVVYTSDQGIHWGEHGWAGKGSAYEEAVHVPMVVRYPALAPLAGQRDELVLNIDLAPTLVELAGGVTAPVDGRSWRELLGGGASAGWRESFLIENPEGLIVRQHVAVRTTRWKYIVTAQPTGPFEELYDLASDPYERENLASHPDAAIVKVELARLLAGHLAE